MWMFACPADNRQQFCAEDVAAWLDDVSRIWGKSLSPEACHGAFMVSFWHIQAFSKLTSEAAVEAG